MHPHVQKLQEVQQVDQKIARLQRQQESVPRESAERESRLEAARRAAETSAEKLQTAELRSREVELSVKQADEELKNLELKLNTIKNNAEYQAILFQIESVKKERGTVEDEGVQILEQMDALQENSKLAQSALEQEERVFEEFQVKAKQILAEKQAEIQEISGGRDAALEGVPPELIEEYDRLFAVRDGLAVCAVESQFCQGCYTNITMNDLAKLSGGRSVVQCGSCQRILYLPA
ncbi:MAG: zinc ribbon domain-containing protein [Planctomycetota bacterium]